MVNIIGDCGTGLRAIVGGRPGPPPKHRPVSHDPPAVQRPLLPPLSAHPTCRRPSRLQEAAGRGGSSKADVPCTRVPPSPHTPHASGCQGTVISSQPSVHACCRGCVAGDDRQAIKASATTQGNARRIPLHFTTRWLFILCTRAEGPEVLLRKGKQVQAGLQVCEGRLQLSRRQPRRTVRGTWHQQCRRRTHRGLGCRVGAELHRERRSRANVFTLPWSLHRPEL